MPHSLSTQFSACTCPEMYERVCRHKLVEAQSGSDDEGQLVTMQLLGRILSLETGYLSVQQGARVALLVNSLGCVMPNELHIAARAAIKQLQETFKVCGQDDHDALSGHYLNSHHALPGLQRMFRRHTTEHKLCFTYDLHAMSLQVEVARVYAGTFMTSLDMSGFSLSVCTLDDERTAALDAVTQVCHCLDYYYYYYMGGNP